MPPRGVEHASGRLDGRAQQRHVVAQRLAEAAGLDEIALEVDAQQRELDRLDAEEARALLAAGEFPAGSMGPKIESALAFLAAGGRETIITSLPALTRALQGDAGTRITSADPALSSAPAEPDLAEEHA